MLTRIRDRNIWVIYATILLLGIAYGTSIAVLAIHLDAHGIEKSEMGALAAAFAMGIITFAMPAGAVIARLGAKRTLFGALLGYAACVASFPFLDTLPWLALARFFDGAFSVHVWVAAETALLSRASKDDKGFVMSLYAISLAVGYVVGPILARVVAHEASTTPAFLTAGLLAAFAAGLVRFAYESSGPRAVSHDEHALPVHDASAEDPVGSVRSVFWRTKTSCLATFSYGYFQASVVLFLPLYLIEDKHVPKDRTILVTAFFAAGMLTLSTWAGRLGDKHGYLRVMRVLGAVGGAMVASFAWLDSFAVMCLAVFVAGATLASISPVSLALQGVAVKPAELGRANALYNGSYALGMLLGPPLSGALFTKWGGATMLLHLAVGWAAFVAFTIVFAADDPRTPHKSERLTTPDATSPHQSS